MNCKIKKTKVLIFSVEFGLGHNVCANIIKKGLEELNESETEVQIQHVNAFGDTRKNQGGKIFGNSYAYFTTKLNWLYKWFFVINHWSVVYKFIDRLNQISLKNQIKKHIKEFQPDKIVTTYYLGTVIHLALKELKEELPVVTVVTEFWGKPTNAWFLDKKSHYLVFNEKGYNTAIKNNISKNNVVKLPPFVDPIYKIPLTDNKKIEIKKELGLNPNASKTVFVLSGGDGLANGNRLVETLIKSDYFTDNNLIVVCGRDQAFLNECSTLKEKYSRKNTLIYGYINLEETPHKIHELINIADCVITKTGTATVTQLLTLKKTFIINSFIAGQEEDNKNYVCENNFAVYKPNSKDVLDYIKNGTNISYGKKNPMQKMVYKM